MKKTMMIMGGCLVFASLLIITLYAVTRKAPPKPNNFTRVYNQLTATKTCEMDIQFNSYYIAAVTDENVYLGNTTAPFHLLLTNNALTDSQHVKLRIKNVDIPNVSSSTTVKVDPPNFYLADGTKAALYIGKIGEWQAESITHDTIGRFTQLTPIGRSSFAIRTNETKTLDNILGKIKTDTPHVQLRHGLLQKQVDGIFCTDGTLVYNDKLKRLIYTYYYRNEYIVYDTNLNLDYRGHTIDTFNVAQVKVGYINSENRAKLMESTTVNLRSCTSDNYLFIRSNLLAGNDPEDRFLRESVIDVYDLTSKHYRFSFTLPHYGEKRVRDFMVLNSKTLIALQGNHIVRYDLQLPILKSITGR